MFKKFIDKIRESDSKVLVGFLGVFTLSGLAYLAYKNYTKKTSQSHIQTPSEINNAIEQGQAEQQSHNLNFPKMLEKVISNIRANSNDQKSAIRAIYEGYHQLATPEFRRLTYKCRKLRRQVMQNLPQYRQILREHEKQIETIRMRCLITILTYFKFELMEWFRLVSKYSTEYKEQWHQLTILTDIMQLNALQDPPQKPIDSQVLVEVFQYKYQIFQQVLHQATNNFKAEDNDASVFIDRRLMDLIHSKFGFEDQDIFLSMIAMGPLAKKKVEDIEQKIRTRIGVFNTNAK